LRKTTYFTKTLVLLSITQISSFLFRFISKIIIARFSTTEIYGLFSVIWNELTLISTLMLIGLGQEITIHLPRLLEAKNEANNLIISSIFYGITMGLISAIISFSSALLNSDSTLKYSAFLSITYILFFILQFIFVGLKDFFGYLILIISQNFIQFILIIILRNSLTINIIVICSFFSILVSLIIAFVYLSLKKKIVFKRIFSNLKLIYKFRKERLFLFIVDVVNSVILYLMLKIPLIYYGAELSGYISVGFSVLSLILILPQMIATAIGPVISQNFSKKNHEKLNHSFNIGLSLSFLLQGVLIITFSFFANYYIIVLFGKEYFLSTITIYYGFVICAIIDSFNYLFGIYIRNTDKEKLFAKGKIFTLTVFSALEIIFLKFMNNKGMSVTFAYFLGLVITFSTYYFSSIKDKKFNQNQITRRMFLWFIFMFISIVTAIFTNFYVNKLYLTLLFSVIYVLLFILFVWVARIINFREIFQGLNIFIRKK